MSEESTTYQIRDEAAPRDFYAMIPNLVDIMDLSPHAYRLYGHLRKVAGESGKCWQSTKTLSIACGMSMGKISEAKTELENVYPPLIRIESKKFDRGSYHEIAITDIWQINHDFFLGAELLIKTAKGVAFHNVNESRSYYESLRSQYETKNNPIKEEPKTGANAPITEMPIDWQLAAGVSTVTPLDEKEAQIKDAANLIATGTGTRSSLYYSIAYAFMKARQIVISQSDVKGQRKAIKEMLEYNVQPDHVTQAVQKLIDAGMTFTDLFGVKKTAISLANAVTEGYNPQGIEVGF